MSLAHRNTQPNNPNGRRYELNGPATALAAVALSTLASVGGTIAANETSELPPRGAGISTTAEVAGHQVEVGADVGMQDALPGPANLNLPGLELWAGERTTEVTKHTTSASHSETVTTKESVAPEVDVQLMEWARMFDADPAAVEPRGVVAMQHAVAVIKDLLTRGYTIEGIHFTGTASDEDDYAVQYGGTNPGFGIHSDKNIKLANKRATAVRTLVTDMVVQQFTQQKSNAITALMDTKQGIEVQDPKLVARIDDLAAQMGMNTVDLVMQYNRDPGSLPKAAQKLLNGLREDRFVKIEIQASKTSESEVTTYVEGPTTYEETEDSKGGKLVFIPIIIPILRRRRDAESTPNSDFPFDPSGMSSGTMDSLRMRSGTLKRMSVLRTGKMARGRIKKTSLKTETMSIVPLVPYVKRAPKVIQRVPYVESREAFDLVPLDRTSQVLEHRRFIGHKQPLRGSNFPSRGGKTQGRAGRGRAGSGRVRRDART